MTSRWGKRQTAEFMKDQCISKWMAALEMMVDREVDAGKQVNGELSAYVDGRVGGRTDGRLIG